MPTANSALAAHVADYLDRNELDSPAALLGRLRSVDLDPSESTSFLDGVLNVNTGFFRHPGALQRPCGSTPVRRGPVHPGPGENPALSRFRDHALSRARLPRTGPADRGFRLGGSLEHDSRDNFFTAGAGWKGGVEAMFYSPDWGGDSKYETYRAQAFGYAPIARNFILGAKVDTRSANGDGR